MNTSLATTQQIAAPALTKAQQDAWLGMAQAKNQIAADLSNAELKAQSILLPVQESQDYKAIDAASAEYRKAHTDMIEQRKTFTGLVDAGIIQPLMAPEKRVDPKTNLFYIALQAKSLELRQEETKKTNEANARQQEKARFTAHCANEFYRVNEDLRIRVRAEIDKQYQLHLASQLRPDVDEIKGHINKIQPTDIRKFGVTTLSNNDLLDMFSGFTKPDIQDIYNEASEYADTLFANFDSDLANADQAIAHNAQQQDLFIAEAASTTAQEMAMNTLIAMSEAVVIDGPKIKKTLTIVTVESEQWAKSIMAAFIINLQHCGKYIRVKSWANLTVGQMANALAQLATETGVTFSNIVLNEVEK